MVDVAVLQELQILLTNDLQADKQSNERQTSSLWRAREPDTSRRRRWYVLVRDVTHPLYVRRHDVIEETFLLAFVDEFCQLDQTVRVSPQTETRQRRRLNQHVNDVN